MYADGQSCAGIWANRHDQLDLIGPNNINRNETPQRGEEPQSEDHPEEEIS